MFKYTYDTYELDYYQLSNKEKRNTQIVFYSKNDTRHILNDFERYLCL